MVWFMRFQSCCKWIGEMQNSLRSRLACFVIDHRPFTQCWTFFSDGQSAHFHLYVTEWWCDIFFVIYFHHMWMFSLIFIQTSTAPEVEFHHWKVIISLVLYKIVEKSYYFLKFCWEKGLQGSKKKHPTKFFAWPAWSLCTGKCKHTFCLNVVFCYMCEHVITRLDICVLALN